MATVKRRTIHHVTLWTMLPDFEPEQFGIPEDTYLGHISREDHSVRFSKTRISNEEIQKSVKRGDFNWANSGINIVDGEDVFKHNGIEGKCIRFWVNGDSPAIPAKLDSVRAIMARIGNEVEEFDLDPEKTNTQYQFAAAVIHSANDYVKTLGEWRNFGAHYVKIGVFRSMDEDEGFSDLVVHTLSDYDDLEDFVIDVQNSITDIEVSGSPCYSGKVFKISHHRRLNEKELVVSSPRPEPPTPKPENVIQLFQAGK